VSQSQALGQFTYQRHEPEDTVLYQIVQQNLETFLRLVQEETGHPLPDFVVKEFKEYLKCGILAHGFLRVQCQSCHNEHLVAFSCKVSTSSSAVDFS
jgi:8-oxo-dGTP pyrophosphatase MutT (NUDIX family)